jgi:hypothetical protein
MVVSGLRHAPAALPPGKRIGTHCIGDWVGPRAGLDGYGKFCPPPGFFFVLCTLSILLYPDCSHFFFLPLLYNTHHTNAHAPGGIRSRNPSKRAATRIGFDPRTVQPAASQYTDSLILAHCRLKVARINSDVTARYVRLTQK